jgi:hypothetical protein
MITEEAMAVIADFGLSIEEGDSNSRNGQVAPLTTNYNCVVREMGWVEQEVTPSP